MIVIAATFVAEPVQPPLEWLMAELGFESEIRFAPYNQVFQQLLTPTSDIRRNAAGINVLLVRFEDFFRDLGDTASNPEIVERAAREFSDAFQAFAGQTGVPNLMVLLPPGPNVPVEQAQAIRKCNEAFFSRFSGLGGVEFLSDENLDALLGANCYDPIRDKLAHIPYTEVGFAALSLAIARRIHAIKVNPAKVLVLDCDNTLWRGVVGEDGVDGIEISASFVALQEFAVEQHAKGILVCLVSKNIEADVLQVLERRPEMKLRLEHLVAHRINWESKPANILSLAVELNLSLDAFVFLDDNPVECAQMRAELPQVVTIQTPPEPDLPRLLRHLWSFDKLIVTPEDTVRTQMYRQNSARRKVESSTADIGEFLASLNLSVEIAPPTQDEWPRIEQLTQRTNQFNFTTRRRSALELKALVGEGVHVLRVHVSDRFGDYGLVGCLVAVKSGAELSVDTFLLSCRVLGRGVEHAMMRTLGELAQSSGLSEVALPYIATARNVPARAFADSVASEYIRVTPERIIYRVPADRATLITHRPGQDPQEVMAAIVADEKKAPQAASASDGERSERYSRLAHVLISGEAVLEQMAVRPRLRRGLPGEAVRPALPLELELLQLWEELLNTDGLGVEDNFFELGGTSLLSVRLFAEISRRYGAQLPLTSILDAPTVRSQALLISSSGMTQRQGGPVCLRRGGPRNLFLIHDGLGETLLYLNLAKRLPPSVSVYGIEPKRLPGIPLAHARIEDMATHYVEQVRQIQPKGPYILGGMCAGGIIAYEMAAHLVDSGEDVRAVIILDGAAPQAVKRSGLATRHRMSRLKEALTKAQVGKSSALRWLPFISTAARKGLSAIAYEIAARIESVSIKSRFLLGEYLIRRGARWPASLRALSVMQIYNIIESRYRPRRLKNVPVLLVRASVGDGLDTPHRHVYRDEDFGWRDVAEKLELVDVVGGHSSMLQEQAVGSLVAEIQRRIPALSGTISEPEA